MKKLFFGLVATAFLAACNPNNSSTTTTESNNSSTSPSTSPSTNTNTTPATTNKIEGLSLKATYNDSLYGGAANPIRIEYANPTHLILEVESGQLQLAKKEEGNNNDFFLLPTADALQVKTVTLTVTDTTTKQSQNFVYPVRRLPQTEEDFIFALNGKTAGNIAAKDFQAFDSISISIKNIPLDIAYRLESYELWYQRKGQDPVLLTGLGRKIDGQARKAIALAKKGDTYTFKRVKVKIAGMVIGKPTADSQYIID